MSRPAAQPGRPRVSGPDSGPVSYATLAHGDVVEIAGKRHQIAAIVQHRGGFTVQFADTTVIHDPDRADAEDAARAVAHQAERLGLALDDLSITAPCPTCRRTGFTISIGAVSPEEAQRLARALRAVPAEAVWDSPEDAG